MAGIKKAAVMGHSLMENWCEGQISENDRVLWEEEKPVHAADIIIEQVF